MDWKGPELSPEGFHTSSSVKPEASLADVKSVLLSKEYREDLLELNAFASNIKHERPIMLFLAKHLNARGFHVVLEKQKVDLVVNEAKIEAKFYYESDLIKLERELRKAEHNVHSLRNRIDQSQKAGFGWSPALSILKDVFGKLPDIFLLVISSRDLRQVERENPNLLMEICWSAEEIKYNKRYGFNNQQIIDILTGFLRRIRELRTFRSDYVRLDIAEDPFPLTYHFHICDFR